MAQLINKWIELVYNEETRFFDISEKNEKIGVCSMYIQL